MLPASDSSVLRDSPVGSGVCRGRRLEGLGGAGTAGGGGKVTREDKMNQSSGGWGEGHRNLACPGFPG